MASTTWTPFGVKLKITAEAVTVSRTSETTFEAELDVSWKTYYDGARTNYGMKASSGGVTVTLNPFGTTSNDGSGTIKGKFGGISGTGATTGKIAVVFENFNTDLDISEKSGVTLDVTIPAVSSYTVSYDANGGSGAPSSQTKWKGKALTLTSSKPSRVGYTFQGWSKTASGSVAYAPGGSYTSDASIKLYAVWSAVSYVVSYNANGGSGAPASQTKTHDVTLTLANTKPTRQNYTFKGWGTSASATTVTYSPGGLYTNNSGVTLYAIWEAGYNKPRITNLSVMRCAQDGTVKGDGVYALVSFDWASDNDVSEIKIAWKTATSAAYSSSKNVGATGKSGHVSQVVGDGALDASKSYTIQATVTDSGGSSDLSKTLNSLKFTFHGKAGGDGAAFGKVAELGAGDSLGGSGVVEFAFDGKFNQPVYGKALGMDRVPPIPAYSDLNNIRETGCYAIYSNSVAETILNIPVARAGRFEVWSATGEGVRAAQWSYLRQRFIPYNMNNAVWERELMRGENNNWNCYAWWRSSLTPEASAKVYAREILTVGMSSDTKIGVVNSYTPIPFNAFQSTNVPNSRLTFDANTGYVVIGDNVSRVKASGQILVLTSSTSGNRHVRIQKLTGNETRGYAWIYLTPAVPSIQLYSFSPVVIPVEEGDRLRVVYYAPDANDKILSGSMSNTNTILGNGAQSYFTVEEI